MRKLLLVSLVVCGMSAAVFADGKLSGRVVDLDGQPVKGASVVVTGPGGTETRVVTDAAGAYVATVATGGLYSVVFARGTLQVHTRIDIPADGAATLDTTLALGGETIEIRDLRVPLQYARPTSDPLLIPPYSDEAVLGDRWAKAWLLLEVDERGVVSRVKFLHRPGYHLDDIAVRHVFGMTFDPARDKSGVPTRSYVVWPLEWPSIEWLQSRSLLANRLPRFAAVAQVPGGLVFDALPPCAQDHAPDLGAIHPMVRDCSIPNLSVADASEPWIKRDSGVAPPAVAPAPVIDPRQLREDQLATVRRYRTSAIVATAATAALTVSAVLAYRQYDKYSERVLADEATRLTGGAMRLPEDQRRKTAWELGTVGLTLGALAAGATAAHFWMNAPQVTLEPSGQGAALSYAGRF